VFTMMYAESIVEVASGARGFHVCDRKVTRLCLPITCLGLVTQH